MSNIAIETKNLTKKFGDLVAVDDFSIALESGKIYGFIGPNGAGKTTTISLLMDLIIPTKGEAYIKGYKVGTTEAKKLLGYSPEFPSFYSDMTCIDYMVYMGCLGGLSYEAALKKALELLKFMNLEKHLYKKVHKFSTGMKKKIGLAQAMIHDPEILLLDEPTANLDPSSRMEIISALKTLVKEKSLTLVISSHVLTELELIITDVIMINKGKLITYGPLNDVKNKFNQDEYIIKTSNNKLLVKNIKKYAFIVNIQETGNELKITTNNSEELKRAITKIAYENDFTIDKIIEDNISLDDVYRNLVESKQGGEL